MADSELRISELDFDTIKENLKTFLSNRSEFRDYDFEASGLSQLLDLLAYNTFYNSFYLNMVSNEMFIDTAVLRGSVASRAKAVGYTPRSVTGATAVGNIVIDAGSSTSPNITIPRYFRFSTSLNDSSFTFATTDSHLAELVNGQYVANNITITEGTVINQTFTKNNEPDQRFVFNNENIDTRTLRVTVQTSATDTTTEVFTLADDITTVDSTSQVYFLNENIDGFYEIFFGDGLVGKQLSAGNIIRCQYLASNGEDPNSANSFAALDSISGLSTINFNLVSQSAGGLPRESVDSIKFNAPRNFSTQNRAVTENDYKRILQREFTAGEDFAVFGGEKNDPPVYGKVFISVKPFVGLTISETQKEQIISILNQYNVVTITPEVVDPDYTFLILNINANYNPEITNKTARGLANEIKTKVVNYILDNVEQFDTYLRYSQLTAIIDDTDDSVLNNITNVTLKKKITPTLGTPVRYTLNFNNAIDSNTLGRVANHPAAVGNQISSSLFTFNGLPNCQLEDNNGIIRVFRRIGGQNFLVNSNVGTVDYEKGTVILESFAPTAITDGSDEIEVIANPTNRDIVPLRNQILTIESDDVSVTMQDDNQIISDRLTTVSV